VVGGNLKRNYYEQFTIAAGSLYSLRVDSLVLNSSFYNTSSGTKMAVVYSKTGFVSDSADVTGGLDPSGLGLASGANGGFTTPILLANETTGGTTKNYRLALNSGTGVSLNAGQTLTIRIYNSCSSTGTPRYGKIKNVIAKGQSTLNPVVGDYRSHQTGDWATASTWERWDGTTWVTPAPTYPVYNNSNIKWAYSYCFC
jgi:pectinesterase